MRKLLFILSLIPLLGYAQEWDPVADANAVVTSGKVRFTVNVTSKVLTGELLTAWNELFVVGGARKSVGNHTSCFLSHAIPRNSAHGIGRAR